jgi:hypothetical protein
VKERNLNEEIKDWEQDHGDDLAGEIDNENTFIFLAEKTTQFSRWPKVLFLIIMIKIPIVPLFFNLGYASCSRRTQNVKFY